MLRENDVKTPAPQLSELLEGETLIVCRDHFEITLCNHDRLQTSANADEAQHVRDVTPRDPSSYWSKTQRAERGRVPRRGLNALDDFGHNFSRTE